MQRLVDPFKARDRILAYRQERDDWFKAKSPFLYALENKIISQHERLRRQPLTIEGLAALLLWKGLAKRTQRFVTNNPFEDIASRCRQVFDTDYGDASLIQKNMTALSNDGPGWSGLRPSFTSVMLHFSGPVDSTDATQVDLSYPIWDSRARGAVKCQNKIAAWTSYVHHCRALAKKYQVSMRDLDIALWRRADKLRPLP